MEHKGPPPFCQGKIALKTPYLCPCVSPAVMSGVPNRIKRLIQGASSISKDALKTPAFLKSFYQEFFGFGGQLTVKPLAGRRRWPSPKSSIHARCGGWESGGVWPSPKGDPIGDEGESGQWRRRHAWITRGFRQAGNNKGGSSKGIRCRGIFLAQLKAWAACLYRGFPACRHRKIGIRFNLRASFGDW